MKKYVSRATIWLGIIALLSGVALLLGIILAFVNTSMTSIVMIALGGMFGILFLSCFFSEKSRALIIDTEVTLFSPRLSTLPTAYNLPI